VSAATRPGGKSVESEARPSFISEGHIATMFLSQRAGTVSLSRMLGPGVAVGVRRRDEVHYTAVPLTLPEARALAFELLRQVDLAEELPRVMLERASASNVPNPWAGQGAAMTAPRERADGSAFDPEFADTLPAPPTPSALVCGRDGCAHVFEMHEEGRCAHTTYATNGRAERCACLGFVGNPPEGRGHVPVCAT